MEYRLYFLGPDCRIAGPPRGLTADNDEAAIAAAGAIYQSAQDQSHGFELWQEGRRVHTENCETWWLK